MKDKIVLITGSSSGIGKQSAIELAALGATVLIHACTAEKGKEVMNSLYKQLPSGSFDLFVANFENQLEIRQMALEIKDSYTKIDVLINNAAIFMEERKLSQDTIEKMFAVNHLASFLITHLLLPQLRQSSNPRIINVSSHAHYTAQFRMDNLRGEKNFNGIKAYCCTKLCNLLFTYRLSELLKEEKISVNALHPGFTNTGMYVKLFGEFDGGTLSDSADTIVYLASSRKVQQYTGLYFMSRLPVTSSAASYKKKYQQQLWKLSEQLTMVHSDQPLKIKDYRIAYASKLVAFITRPIKLALYTIALKKIFRTR